jgi:hypothetical protein
MLVLLASCRIERNPGVCCTNDSECARLGLPPGSASDYGCGVGEVCSDFYCVPEEAPISVIDNGQRADLVLGQELFTTSDPHYDGRSARSLGSPFGVTIDDVGRLWINDTSSGRVLMWSAMPEVSFAEAALVIGTADFTSKGGGCSGPTAIAGGQSQLAARGGKLLVAAPSCNRVMIWNPTPTTNGAPASIALGQPSFTDMASGNGATDLDAPNGVWTDGTRLAVVDTGNSRVLIWNRFPTTNKQPADLVLGQPGFGSSGFPNAPNAATMRLPSSVYSDGVRLFVADQGNARVLVWRAFPTASGQPADFAIGQPNLTSDGRGYGASELNEPSDATTAGDHLFVADSRNNRVLVFSPIPTDSGASASFVLGQQSFETNTSGTTQETFYRPWGLAAAGSELYVTDSINNRVLRFHLRL